MILEAVACVFEGRRRSAVDVCCRPKSLEAVCVVRVLFVLLYSLQPCVFVYPTMKCWYGSGINIVSIVSFLVLQTKLNNLRE